MDDLDKYIAKKKKSDKKFAETFDLGYREFKVGALLKVAREESGFTQEEIARKLRTKKSAISRIENHADDIRLSTIDKFVSALGKELKLQVV